MAPPVGLENPAFQNCLAWLDALTSSGEAEPVQAAEGIECRGRGGSVRHVEVFQMASVRTSIIGRPRRLSPHRRAHPATSRYTLICEEPLMVSCALLVQLFECESSLVTFELKNNLSPRETAISYVNAVVLPRYRILVPKEVAS